MNHYLHIFYHHISKKWCQSQKYVEMPLTSWASLYLDTLNFWDRNFRIFGGMSQRVLYVFAATAAAKLLQWCLTLCNPIDGSPPGSPIPGILQARTLEWVAISFSSNSNYWWIYQEFLDRQQMEPTTKAFSDQSWNTLNNKLYWIKPKF